MIRTNREDDPNRIPKLLDGELLHEGYVGCIRAVTATTGTGIRIVSGENSTGRDARVGTLLTPEQFDLFIDSLIGLRAEAAKRRELLNDGKLVVQKQDTDS